MKRFSGSSAGKESACNAGDPGSIPGSGRSPGEGNSCPLQYPGLENSMHSSGGCKESEKTERLSFFLHLNLISVRGTIFVFLFPHESPASEGILGRE